jgi:hypothetical protein
MTDVEFALLELKMLKQGIPFHEHENSDAKKWLCSSPYCHSRFQDDPVPGPQESDAVAHTRYFLGSL